MTDQPAVTDDPLTIIDLFPDASIRPRMELVAAVEVPPPYRELLVHTHHMTVTVERFHREQVDVRLLEKKVTDDWYARRIVLVTQQSAQIVQYGIARIRLQYCSPPVRDAILAEQTPLGRILIENNVLREIVPVAFLRVMPGPAVVDMFGPEAGLLVTYGRLGAIHCDEKPAIEVLEIVAPVPIGGA